MDEVFHEGKVITATRKQLRAVSTLASVSYVPYPKTAAKTAYMIEKAKKNEATPNYAQIT